MTFVLTAAAFVSVAVLLTFTLRRLVFLVASLVPPRRHGDGATPSVTLLVPAQNESGTVGAALDAIAQLDYPDDRLFVILVDDGSSDETGELFRRWAAGRPHTFTLALAQPLGKFQALNRAAAVGPRTDVIAVCDADLLPHPAWIRRLVAPFADERVGATAGLVSPANPERGSVARYAAVEAWVHQLITSAAKDRLGLNPPTLGACAYRRSALEEVGLFKGDGSGGDVLASADLTRAGWRIRFAPDAVVDSAVVERWSDYWHQHVRWARNVFSTVRPRAAVRRPIGLVARAEEWMAAASYADRIAFLSVGAFVVAGLLPLWPAAVYLAVAVAEVAVAVWKAGRGTQFPRFFLVTASLFVVDVAASVVAAASHLARGQRAWRQPSRGVVA